MGRPVSKGRGTSGFLDHFGGSMGRANRQANGGSQLSRVGNAEPTINGVGQPSEPKELQAKPVREHTRSVVLREAKRSPASTTKHH